VVWVVDRPSQVPPTFPLEALPPGLKSYIDEEAINAALETVPGLARKHDNLVPSKVRSTPEVHQPSAWIGFGLAC
jgi:hypothetical protein